MKRKNFIIHGHCPICGEHFTNEVNTVPTDGLCAYCKSKGRKQPYKEEKINPSKRKSVREIKKLEKITEEELSIRFTNPSKSKDNSKQLVDICKVIVKNEFMLKYNRNPTPRELECGLKRLLDTFITRFKTSKK